MTCSFAVAKAIYQPDPDDATRWLVHLEDAPSVTARGRTLAEAKANIINAAACVDIDANEHELRMPVSRAMIDASVESETRKERRMLSAAMVAKYGERDQLTTAMEELCELSVELSHHMRGRPNARLRVVAEVADVRAMLEQVEAALHISPEEIEAFSAPIYERHMKRVGSVFDK